MGIIKKIFNILDTTDKKKFLVLFLFIVLTTFLETLSLTMVIPLVGVIADPQNYIDKIIGSQYFLLQNLGIFLSSLDFNKLILFFLSLIIVLFIFKFFILSLTIWLSALFTASVENNTSKKLFNFYLNQNYNVHLYRDSSIILQNLVGEISRFASSACLPLLILITESLIVISISLVLFLVEPTASIFIFIFLTVISSLFFIVIKKKMKIWGEQTIFYNQKRLQDINQSVGGIREILIMWKQEYFFKKFINSTKGATNVGRKQYFFLNLPRVIFELAAVFALVFLIYFLFFIKNASSEIIPIIAFFAAASFKLIPSANRILNSLQTLRFSIANVDRIYADIEKLNVIKSTKFNSKKIIKNIDNFNEIELKDIAFSYFKDGSDKKVLSNLNLKFLKGEAIGLVGETGSGKTTLVDLFLGLLPPTRGNILIDQKETYLLQNNLWQNMIGYVPQDVYLINDTIKKNIAFGLNNKESDLNKILEVIKISKLENLIKNSTNGINTIIGERGVNLSGGQRQRIGIARALYNNTKILVFDEATSSLDNQTEKEILNEIFKIKKDKTIIMISHKHSALKDCDKIYELSNGMLNLISK